MSSREMINSSEAEPPKYVVVLMTAPTGKGREIARILVERKLCACINVVSGVYSVYWWQGRVEDGEEELLICKTLREKLNELQQAIREVHPYEIPEIIAIEIVKGLREYLEWVRSSIAK